ncbi:MAG: hypothetical protein IPL78_17830 [Chloroflexi bacterium]|nr:hypothetical protein [Chloroflexota bacterium]
MRNLLSGELGISYHTNRPVMDLLMEYLWNTVLLIGGGAGVGGDIGDGVGHRGRVESPHPR